MVTLSSWLNVLAIGNLAYWMTCKNWNWEVNPVQYN
jgi:hypothetical protein